MDIVADKPIINVSSVPHRSPFRYPGGKTWLVPHFREWIRSLHPRPLRLVEPFAGGAAISLAAAAEKLVDEVVFGEMDPGVAAVWKVVLGPENEKLERKIRHFDFTLANVDAALEQEPVTGLDLAWQTLLRNRIQRGGIMAPGAGRIKLGDNARGLGARWYSGTLAHRIQSIGLLKSRLSFVPGDAFDLMARFAGRVDTAFYLDPPYLVASRRLYQHWKIDHRALFAQVAQCRGAALLSYDDATEIRDLAEEFRFSVESIQMKNTHHIQQRELLIFKSAHAPGKA
jgi:DNA adenine methylase